MSKPTKTTTPSNGASGNPQAAQAALEALIKNLPQSVQVEMRAKYAETLKQRLSDDPNIESFFPPLRLINAEQIIATEYKPPVWIVEDYLPAGMAFIAGRPKVGKSWLALQICRSVSTGKEVFGKHVERGRALYLALEDNARRLKDRMRKQGWPDKPRGIDFMMPDDFRAQLKHLNGGGGALLAKTLEKNGYRLVVIDTLSRAFKGDQKDESEMTQALAPLQEVALRLDLAVLVIDHHKKPMTAADQNPIDDILGSTAKSAVADAAWGLYAEQGKAGFKLSFTGRDIEQMILKLTRGEDMIYTSEGEAFTIELTEQRKAVLDYLRSTGEAQVGPIARGIGAKDEGNLFKNLQNMVNAGMLKRVTKGQNVFYALPEQPEQPPLTAL